MPRTESHTHLGVRLNVRRELKRLQRDPLEHFLKVAYPDHTIGTPRHRYENSYELYRVAMERALEQVSTAVRYRKGPYYVRKYGGTYGTRQRLLAQKHRRLERFLELDITTALLHARILLDRTVALSRVFLKGSRLPSFSSFNAHKKFFQKPDHVSRVM